MSKKLLYIAGVSIGILAAFIPLFGVSAHYTEKLTVCHKTHSDTNPWVEQIINANELQSHLANGDFLVNSDHACPPVTPTPTIGETITPSPIVFCDVDQDCVTPTITTDPTTTPTASPSATPTPGPQNGGGSSGPVDDGLGCGHHSCAPPQGPPNTGRAEE